MIRGTYIPKEAENTTVITTHGDADGISAGVIRALEQTESNIVLATGGKFDMDLATAANQIHEDLTYRTYRVNQPENALFQYYIQDASLDKQGTDLQVLLGSGAKIHFVDHHAFDVQRYNTLVQNTNFSANIDTSRSTSTANIVNTEAQNQHNQWAILGLLGDRITATANELAKVENLSETQYSTLAKAAQALNYNSFSQTKQPVDLLHSGMRIKNAYHFSTLPEVQSLSNERDDAIATTNNKRYIQHNDEKLQVHVLEDSDISRAIFSEIAYTVANQEPQKWHAVVVAKHPEEITETGKLYDVSLRGPHSVSELAKSLGGGGRETAGGAGVKKDIDYITKTLSESEVYYR